MNEPIITIKEITDKEKEKILKNNDVIEVRLDNLDEVCKKIEKKIDEALKNE